MKVIIIFVSFSLFLLIGTNVYSQEPLSPEGQVQSGELESELNASGEIETKENKNSTSNRLSSINKIDIQSGNNKPQNVNNKDSSSKPKDDHITNYNFWLMVLTAGLLCCNIFLLLSTKKAADAAMRSANSLPITERAYLFVDSIEWPKGEDGFTLSEYNNLNLIKVIITNVGRTPAILSSVSAKISIKESEYPTRDAVRGKLEIVLPKGVIIKSDGMEKISCGQVIGPSIITEKEFRQSTILCYGYIIYEDIFGKSHETGFCYEFKPIYSEGQFHISQNRELNYHT